MKVILALCLMSFSLASFAGGALGRTQDPPPNDRSLPLGC